MSAAASSERWEERRSDDELVFGGEIKECESVIASLLRALLHFIDSYHGHNSKILLPTLYAVLDMCDERRIERSRGLGGRDKDGKCVHDSQWRWNELEGAEGEDGAPYGSGISPTINSVCRGEVAMETPLYIPHTEVSMVTGPSRVTLGLPRRLGIMQRPSCHSRITFPAARCKAVLETGSCHALMQL